MREKLKQKRVKHEEEEGLCAPDLKQARIDQLFSAAFTSTST